MHNQHENVYLFIYSHVYDVVLPTDAEISAEESGERPLWEVQVSQDLEMEQELDRRIRVEST